MPDEKILIDIDVKAFEVVKKLNEINKSADSAAGKARLLQRNLSDLARASGKDFDTVLKKIQEFEGQVFERQTKMGVQRAKFTGFKTPLGQTVTGDVYQEAAALNKAAAAKNEYVTADSKAAAAEKNFDSSVKKVNASLGEQKIKLQALNAELNKLKSPPQGRDALGRFTKATPPSFAAQFVGAGNYQQQLKLVETTISSLAAKTGMAFKDVGAQLQKTFPELLKDTNLVTTATQNLTKANQGLSASFKTEAEAISLVQRKLTEMQAAGRLNLTGSNTQRVESLKSIIKEVSQATGAQYAEVSRQLQLMGVPAAQAQAAVKGLNAELTKGTREAQGFRHGIDTIRTALGTLVAVGIFTALNAITQFFRGAIDQARQFEETLYRIGNAERQLSQAGIEVTVRGLREGIEEIQKALPIFSKEDVSQLVGSLATTTKELGFTEEQTLKLGAAISILNINSTETETLLQTQAKVTNAVISPQARSIGNLGLAFGKLKMEAKGAELGIKKTLSEMTDAEKTKIKLQIVLETAGIENIDDISKLREEIQKSGGDFQALNEYLDSNTARLAANGAAWKDLQTTVGQIFLPLLPGLTKFIQVMTDGFNGLKVVIIEASAGFMGLVEAFKAVKAAFDTGEDVGGAFFGGLGKGIDETRKKLVNKFFPGGLTESAGPGIKNLYGPLINPPRETVTNPAELYKDAGEQAVEAVEDSEEKIIDIMADARDKRADIDENYRRKIEDANRDHAQKMQDIARDVSQKQEDALRNYNQKVEDVNRDANEKIAEANRDAKQKEIDREKEFQQKLKELRDEFLFDLEDALRERDARQVLRLIRQYNMDKKHLEERRKLDRQESKKDLAQKLEDIERERIIKLEAAKRELAEKQAEIAIWQQREQEDAKIALQRKLADARQWHQRELQEYQQYLQRKLQELAKAIVKEYQLTAAGAQAVYNLLKGYFGSTGSISQLLGMGLNTNLNKILSTSASTSTASPTWAQAGMYGAAEGGTFIATRPTRMLVGEKGMEKVSITPLSRTGADVNKVFTNGSIGEGAGGSLSLRVALTEGLVAEIIESSLDSVAATIERIRREK